MSPISQSIEEGFKNLIDQSVNFDKPLKIYKRNRLFDVEAETRKMEQDTLSQLIYKL
jgi:hypothetical protein